MNIQKHFAYLFFSSTDDQEALFDQIMMGQLDFPLPYWDNVSDSAKVGIPKQSLKVLKRKINLILFFFASFLYRHLLPACYRWRLTRDTQLYRC